GGCEWSFLYLDGWGVRTLGLTPEDGGLIRVTRIQASLLDLRSFGRIAPVIVAGNQAIAVAQFQGRIGHESLDLSRRSKGADNDLLRLGAGDNETTDEGVIAYFHTQSARDVEQLRGAG